MQTCEIFQCHPRSLMRWVDKYNKNKDITRKKKLPKALQDYADWFKGKAR